MPNMLMYYGIVEHVRGSVAISASTDLDDEDLPFIAMPLVPELDFDDGAYSHYTWESGDD